MAQKKQKSEMKSSEIKPGAALFGERLSGGSIRFEEYEFFYRPLTAAMCHWVGSQCFKSAKPTRKQLERYALELTRCGISDIRINGESMREIVWENAEFGDSKFKIINKAQFEEIPGSVALSLKQHIDAIMNLKDPEKQALDFITALENQE